MVLPLSGQPVEKEQEEELIAVSEEWEGSYTKNGLLEGSVRADEMRLYKDGNIILLGSIELMLLEEDDGLQEQRAFYVRSDKAFYHKEQNLWVMEGNVQLEQPCESLKVITAQLSYDRANEIIFTEEPIEIMHRGNHLKGSGIRATRYFKDYTIYNPIGMAAVEGEAMFSCGR